MAVRPRIALHGAPFRGGPSTLITGIDMTFKAKAPKDPTTPSFLHADENKGRNESERVDNKYRLAEGGNARPTPNRGNSQPNSRPTTPSQAKEVFRPSSACKP